MVRTDFKIGIHNNLGVDCVFFGIERLFSLIYNE